VTAADGKKRQRHVAVLVDHVHQMIQLVAQLDAVCSPPAALEKSDVLVELVMLVGIERRESGRIGRGGGASGLLQTRRQRLVGVVYGSNTVCAVTPLQIGRLRLPAEIVIVLKEVAIAGGRHDGRGQGYVRANVVGRIWSRPTEAVRKRRQGGSG